MIVRMSGVPDPLGPPRSCTVVPKFEGGAPKLLPVIVTTEPQVPVGVVLVITGTGTAVSVGVAVSVPGVFVKTGVIVGVAVAPSGAKALKPEVMHGRRPSA